jgi:hypothetical protein
LLWLYGPVPAAAAASAVAAMCSIATASYWTPCEHCTCACSCCCSPWNQYTLSLLQQPLPSSAQPHPTASHSTLRPHNAPDTRTSHL